MFQLQILNTFPGQKILLEINWKDVLIGLTIYLKTAIDFALLIGILMNKFPGTKNRIAIEIGTAFGNALGTMLVLTIWFFFKEISWLLGLMIIFASLILFKLAQTSLEHIDEERKELEKKVEEVEILNSKTWVNKTADFLNSFLKPINKILDPLLSKIVPDMKFDSSKTKGFSGLFVASFTIPFILGMDDFAGYVPLFNVVNVFGFGLGVFAGHTILNIFLFLNPNKTIKTIKNPIISVLGSVAFILLAFWGFWEASQILFGVH